MKNTLNLQIPYLRSQYLAGALTPSQLVAQLLGVATLLGFVFTMSFVINLVIDIAMGQRVSAEAELEGLDIPEMGALAYPDFVLNES